VAQELWKLPVPATGLVHGPRFVDLPKRNCAISFSIEGADGSDKEISLVFEEIEVYKCTYHSACTSEMVSTAYGKLIDLQQSDWLTEVLTIRGRKKHLEPRDLHHLMICFDDGPCYEFICSKFTVK
jgi:hypothetical protein